MRVLNSNVSTTSELITLLSSYTKSSRKRALPVDEKFGLLTKFRKKLEPRVCYSCNRPGHLAALCPEKNKLVGRGSYSVSPMKFPTGSNKENVGNCQQKQLVCTFCGKIGHTEEHCWTIQDKNKQVNFCKVLKPNIYTDCLLYGKRVSCLFNTGLDCSLIKKSFAAEVTSKIEPCCIILGGLGSGCIQTLGKVLLDLQYCAVDVKLDFFVVPNDQMKYEAIIGRNIVDAGNINIVMYGNGTCLVKARTTFCIENTKIIPENIITELRDNDLNTLLPTLFKYPEMFTTGNAVRKVTSAELSINLKKDKVVNYHPYRLTPVERERKF